MTMNQHDPFAGMSLTQADKAMLRKQLEKLVADSAYPGIRDMAQDVLSGRADLRGAMLGSRYEQVINDATRDFSSWYRNLSEEEREEQARLGRELLEAPPRRPRPPVVDDGWEPPSTILKKRKPR